MTREAVDEATILARVDEALATYPLPQPCRVRAVVDRAACLRDMSPEIQELAGRLPPALTIWCLTTRDMQMWAAHLECAVGVRVQTYEDDGRTCRTVGARGDWLGWSVHLYSQEDLYRDVTPPAPLVMVRKAHLGILL